MLIALEVISLIALALTFVFAIDNKNKELDKKYYLFYVTEIVVVILCELIKRV